MSSEPEAQIDRLNQEIQRQAREIQRLRDGIFEARRMMNEWEEDAAHVILSNLLDPGPAARGETPLLEVE